MQTHRQLGAARTQAFRAERAVEAKLLAGQIEIEPTLTHAPWPPAINGDLRSIQQLQLQAQPWGSLASKLRKCPEVTLGVALQIHAQTTQANVGNSTPLPQAAQHIRQQGEPLG